MKKLSIVAIIAAVLLFTGLANAETLNLGGTKIEYDIPTGFVKAAGREYAVILGVMQKAMPSGLRVQSMYVSEADDTAFRTSNGEAGLNNYLIITTLDDLANRKVSDNDFKDFKRELKENHGLLDDAKDIVTDRLDDVFNGQVQIGGMEALGCFGETDSALSYVVVMDQTAVLDGQQITVKQALVFTGVLVNSKLIFVNQYQTVESEAEVSNFKDYTQQVLNNMNFRSEGESVAPVSSFPAGSETVDNTPPSSGMGKLVAIIIVIVVIVVIAGVVMQKKKRN